MRKYNVTEFAFEDGLVGEIRVPKNPALGLRFSGIRILIEDEPTGIIGSLTVSFTRSFGDRTVEAFIESVRQEMSKGQRQGGGGASEREIHFDTSFAGVSGKPMTEMMMEKYFELMKLCGIRNYPAPRITTETHIFHTNPNLRISYGLHLFRKVQKRRRLAQT